MEELKPCPVCGATKGLYILEDYHEFDWYVFCDNCKTSLSNENAQTKEDAIKYWNTRYEREGCVSVEKSGPCYTVYHYSCCGYEHAESKTDFNATEIPANYCPNCGAKVDQS